MRCRKMPGNIWSPNLSWQMRGLLYLFALGSTHALTHAPRAAALPTKVVRCRGVSLRQDDLEFRDEDSLTPDELRE